jgi:hypothetical protein
MHEFVDLVNRLPYNLRSFDQNFEKQIAFSQNFQRSNQSFIVAFKGN